MSLVTTGDELPDMMTVTAEGNLALYPSQADKDGDLDYSMPGAYRANPDKDPNGGDGLQDPSSGSATGCGSTPGTATARSTSTRPPSW
ncbi:hypothetical protein AQJ58_13990 [Streptomyces sp. DSM 15324]|nr:hypothetical protein AQJ58_13990 [Streptomyces sp. DSM 15324]